MKLTDQQKELISFGLSLFTPKPILSGSEWADEHFYLSAESSSQPGKWHTKAWQKEILDEMTNSTTHFISIQKSARVGYTKMLNIAQAYFIHQDPCSILHAQPTDGEIIGYAEDEFEPMIRDNEVIKERIDSNNIRGKNKREKTLKKTYQGGIWEGVGAHSPRNFRRRTVRVAIAEEIDGWELEAGVEGDGLSLLFKRTTDFWNRKNISGGTPTLKDISKVNKRFLSGDQRFRYLPCPHCSHMQPLEFDNMDWDIDEEGNLIPESVVFSCVKCANNIEEGDLPRMDDQGEWVALKPFKRHASFFIWSAYSYDSNYRWRDIVQEYLDCEDDQQKLKVFTNTVLGIPWEEKYESTSADDVLLLKNEMQPGVVPSDTAAIVMAVDVQLDHFWYKVVALKYGAGKHVVRYGRAETWTDLEQIMYTHYIGENNATYMVNMCAVDSGYKRDEVYEFCAMNSDICIPVKGASGKPATPWRVSNVERDINGETIKTGLKLYVIDTEYFKDMLHAQIERSIILRKEDDLAHENLFSVHCNADLGYAKQMTSEYKHCEINKKTGVEKWEWIKVTTKADNHLWDGGVYVTFLSELLGVRFLQRESIQKKKPKNQNRKHQQLRQSSDDFMDNY